MIYKIFNILTTFALIVNKLVICHCKKYCVIAAVRNI